MVSMSWFYFVWCRDIIWKWNKYWVKLENIKNNHGVIVIFSQAIWLHIKSRTFWKLLKQTRWIWRIYLDPNYTTLPLVQWHQWSDISWCMLPNFAQVKCTVCVFSELDFPWPLSPCATLSRVTVTALQRPKLVWENIYRSKNWGSLRKTRFTWGLKRFWQRKDSLPIFWPTLEISHQGCAPGCSVEKKIDFDSFNTPCGKKWLQLKLWPTQPCTIFLDCLFCSWGFPHIFSQSNCLSTSGVVWLGIFQLFGVRNISGKMKIFCTNLWEWVSVGYLRRMTPQGNHTLVWLLVVLTKKEHLELCPSAGDGSSFKQA